MVASKRHEDLYWFRLGALRLVSKMIKCVFQESDDHREMCPDCPYIEFGARLHTKKEVLPTEGS
jgi:hypothetical protein